MQKITKKRLLNNPSLDKRINRTGLTISELFLVVVAIIIIGISTYVSITFVEKAFKKTLTDTLSSMLNSTEASMDIWFRDQELLVTNLARLPQVKQAAESLLTTTSRQGLQSSPSQQDLRLFFKDFLKIGKLQGYFIVNPDNINIASSRDQNLGDSNLLLSQPDILNRAWQGEVVVSRILESDVMLYEQNAILEGTRDLSLFVGSAIRDDTSKVIALIFLRIDPNQTLFPMLLKGHLGKTGEAYIFDKNGLMLSPSRFPDFLSELGLIPAFESSVLNVRLQNNAMSVYQTKQNNLPLTRMAASAVQGEQGIDVSGYPDYRGIPVVGAWLWHENLSVGLTVEQDQEEAYGVYYFVRLMMYGAGIAALLILLSVVFIFSRGRIKLREIQNRLATIVETAVDSIIIIDHQGLIESVNSAVEAMFKYPKNQLIGQNISLLMPEPHHSDHDTYITNYLETGNAKVIGAGRETIARRADGTTFPIELSVSQLELESGLHFSGIVRDISNRKEIETELEQERIFNRDVLNSLSSNIAVLDEFGNIIFVNRSWEEFGLQNGQPPGSNSLGINYLQISEESGDEQGLEVADNLRKMLAGQKKSFSLEYPCHSPDGQSWFDLLATAFKQQGKSRVVIVHTDITEKRLAEDELLREKEIVDEVNKQLSISQNAIERSHIAELWIDAHNAGIIKVNQFACKLLGYSESELLELKFIEIDNEYDSMEQFTAHISKIRERGWVRSEASALTKDGKVIDIEMATIYQTTHDNKDILIAFVMDISERTQAQKALNETTEKLKMMALIAEKTDNAVIVTDLDEKIKWVNHGFTTISGYTLEEVIGKKPSKLLQGEETDKTVLKQVKQSLKRAERVEVELLNYHKNGQKYWIQIEITPVFDKSGDLVEFIALERDITDKQQFQENLRQAKIQAEDANRAKSAFLATMSHEIRTPLNGIVGTIDLLGHSDLQPAQKDMILTARNSSLSLMQIIDDILDFSKIEAGRLSLEEVSFELEPVINDVISILQQIAFTNHVNLLVFCDPRIPELKGDPVRIRQILFNLVGNAIKFSRNLKARQGRVEIMATLEENQVDCTKVSIQVKDNGIGIRPEMQKRLFQPFVQAESSTTRKYGGTGLGLVICRRLVELMQGNIEMESVEGQGTTFNISLNFASSDSKIKNPFKHEFSDLKVTLLNENSTLTYIVENYLRYAGAKVSTLDIDKLIHHVQKSGKNCQEIIIVTDIETTDLNSNCNKIQDIVAEQDLANQLRFLFIQPGKRRHLRQYEDSGVSLDLPALRMSSLLNAIASLAGIESPDLGEHTANEISITYNVPDLNTAQEAGQLILLAEDNETNQKVIKQQLAALGFAVEIAGNGQQALEMWREKKYGLLLTDCHMPEMDGYELTQAIREQESEAQRIPIIAITADALKGTAEKCYEAGMDDYLTKPMQLSQLYNALEKWLPRSPVDTDAESTMPISNTKEVVDSQALGKLLGIEDPEVLATLYKDFVETSDGIVNLVLEAFATKNIDELAQQAHKLKSSARTVGANELADCCFILEKAGKANDIETIGETIAAFSSHYEAVKKWISTNISFDSE